MRKLLSASLLAAVFLLWLAAPAWAAAPVGAGAEYLLAAQKAYKEGEHPLARILFNKAMLSSPERAEAFTGSAKAWVRAGDFQQALYDAQEGARVDPAAVEPYCLLAYLTYLMGDEEGARAAFDDARLLFTANAPLYYARAVFFEDSGDLEQALADYDRALYLYKRRPKRRLLESMLDFSDCANRLPLDNKAAALYLNRGMAHSKAGNFKEARRDLKRAVRLDPELLRYLPEGIVQ